MKKLLFLLGLTTAISVNAGVLEGILAYDYKQYPTALSEFEPMVQEGDPVAAYYLGKMYQNGWGVPQNAVQAYSYFKMADSLHYFPAAAELGKMLLNGVDQIPADKNTALLLLKKAAHAGVADASYELGKIYAEGEFVPADLNYAYGFYLMAALAGHMKGQYALSKLYMDGRGVPQDYVNGLKWMSRSAHQGYVLAQTDLADIYMTNKRLKSAANAYSWYSIIAAYNMDSIGQKAVERRDVLQEELNTKVLEERQQKIRDWKPRTAEESVPKEEREEAKIPVIPGFNDAKSLYELIGQEGFLPRDGRLVGITQRMIDEAFELENAEPLTDQIEQAFQEGKKFAYGYYGDLIKIHFNNPEKALEWYQKGAEAGDAYAAYQLANMYCAGEGVEQPDAAQCYAWLLVAEEKQNPVLNGLIQNALSVVQSTATEEELSAGKERVKELSLGPQPKEGKFFGLNFF